jgi:hypothetical protein
MILMELGKPTATSKGMIDVPLEVRAAGRSVEEFFVRLRSEGASERWAEMCALQKPPGVRGTDRTFMQGRMNNQQLDQMPEDHARNIVTLANRAGINVSGKYYAGGLADGRGPADPKAWVSGADDIKRVAMERNLTVSGAVEHQGMAVERPKSKPLSDRLTKELAQREQKNHPNMKAGELREMVVEKYGRKVKT